MRLLLVSILIVVATLLVGLPRLFHQQQADLHEARVKRQLENFQSQNALVLPESLQKALFSIPERSFYFGGGFTYGQLRQEIAKQNREGTANLERTVSFVEYIRYVAAAFAQGTRYHGQISVNQPPRPGFLNLYFARHSDSSQKVNFQTPQCVYLGFEDAIVCDSDSIASAFAEIDRVSANQSVLIAVLEPDQRLRVNMLANLDILRRLLKQNLLIWLVGHEVGHAVRDRDWILSHDTPLHFDGVYNDREAGADAYVASVVLQDKLLGANFATFLLEFINQQFEQDYMSQYGHASDLVLGKKNAPLYVHTGRFSRPLLLRGIQVIEQVFIRDSSAMERADYTVVDGRLGYIHSLQFPERVAFIRSNMAVRGEPDRQRFTTRIVLGAFGIAVGCMAWLACREKEKR